MEFEFAFNNKMRTVVYTKEDNTVIFKSKTGHVYNHVYLPEELKDIIRILNADQLTTLFYSIFYTHCVGIKQGRIEQRERVKQALGLYDKDDEEKHGKFEKH